MSFLGGLIGLGTALFSHHSAKKQSEQQKDNQMELNEQQLENQKDLFKYENENKHQFEVADLRAAGLNPILSAGASSAASVGGVSNGQAQAAQTPDFSGAFEKMFSALSNAEINKSNAAAERDKAEAAKLQADAAQKDAETNSARQKSDADVNKATIDNLVADTFYKGQLAENSAKLTDAQVQSFRAGAQAQLAIADAQQHLAFVEDRYKAALEKKNQQEIDNLKVERDLALRELYDSRSQAEARYYSGDDGYFRLGIEKAIEAFSGTGRGIGYVRRYKR